MRSCLCFKKQTDRHLVEERRVEAAGGPQMRGKIQLKKKTEMRDEVMVE